MFDAGKSQKRIGSTFGKLQVTATEGETVSLHCNATGVCYRFVLQFFVTDLSLQLDFYRTQVSLGSGLWVPASLSLRAF